MSWVAFLCILWVLLLKAHQEKLLTQFSPDRDPVRVKPYFIFIMKTLSGELKNDGATDVFKYCIHVVPQVLCFLNDVSFLLDKISVCFVYAIFTEQELTPCLCTS